MGCIRVPCEEREERRVGDGGEDRVGGAEAGAEGKEAGEMEHALFRRRPFANALEEGLLVKQAEGGVVALQEVECGDGMYADVVAGK
jgi:hypothetical protein